jgi:flavin reductase (DIM6/NTAB) family NADH-FMN oxidoreductase RutF
LPDLPDDASFVDLIPYGVWGCAVRTPAGRVAIIVTWVTQLSFEPALLGVSLESHGTFLKEVLRSGEFTMSALPRRQGKTIARRILKQGLALEGSANDTLFRREPEWQEAIDGAAAAVQCRVVRHSPAGDHTFVEAVVTREHRWLSGDVLRLSDTGWKYRLSRSNQQRTEKD